jgi:hypothetical protein
MPPRQFPPPWSVEGLDPKLQRQCFIVRDRSGQAPYVYFEEEPGWRAAAKLLTRDEARRIAANVAKCQSLPRLTCRTRMCFSICAPPHRIAPGAAGRKQSSRLRCRASGPTHAVTKCRRAL